LDWSADSGRLLIDLHGGLTGSVETPDRDLYKKPGVSVWVAYFNTKTRKFELTDRLRACNEGAHKRWKAMDNDNEEAPEDGFVPPSAESTISITCASIGCLFTRRRNRTKQSARNREGE